MKPALAAALMLAATSVAAADLSLDAVGGTLYVTSIDGTHAVVDAYDASKNEVSIETLSQNGLPILRISHSRAGLAVHMGAGGTAPLTTALFRHDAPASSQTAVVLRDPRTGTVARPSSLRTIVLDPADPGATLLDAGHFVLTNGTPRAWALARRSSGEALLVDFDVTGGAVRRTPLGFTPPIGSNKGSIVATPDGGAFATFAYPGVMLVVSMKDFITESWLAEPKGTLSLGSGFDPGSIRTGIIAILIGLVAEPMPALSYQVGNELRVTAFDGTGFRTVARQAVPPEALGLIESEGIGFDFMLPYLEQDNLFRGLVGQPAVPITTH